MSQHYPRLATLHGVAGLRARLDALGLSLPCADEALAAPQSPLAQRLAPGDGSWRRTVCDPADGGLGRDAQAGPARLTIRRWQRFGSSGAGLIWGGEAVAVCAEGRANRISCCCVTAPRRRSALRRVHRGGRARACPDRSSDCSSPQRALGAAGGPTGTAHRVRASAARSSGRRLCQRVDLRCRTRRADRELRAPRSSRSPRLRLRRRQAPSWLSAARTARGPRAQRSLRRRDARRTASDGRDRSGAAAAPGSRSVRLSVFDRLPSSGPDRTGISSRLRCPTTRALARRVESVAKRSRRADRRRSTVERLGVTLLNVTAGSPYRASRAAARAFPRATAICRPRIHWSASCVCSMRRAVRT